MASTALLSHFESAPGHAGDLEHHLEQEAEALCGDPVVAAWLAFRYGRDEYGAFAAFPDDAARRSHVARNETRDVYDGPDRWLARPTTTTRVDVFAHKLPDHLLDEPVTKGLLLTFEPRHDHDEEVRRFLIDALPIEESEPSTSAWFGVRLDDGVDRPGTYGLIDVFPDSAGRRRHLAGHVPRELAKEAFTLLGGMPEVHFVDVVASTFAPALVSGMRR